jgi:hypothetical protein
LAEAESRTLRTRRSVRECTEGGEEHVIRDELRRQDALQHEPLDEGMMMTSGNSIENAIEALVPAGELAGAATRRCASFAIPRDHSISTTTLRARSRSAIC